VARWVRTASRVAWAEKASEGKTMEEPCVAVAM
jgi:hypothetical protein